MDDYKISDEELAKYLDHLLSSGEQVQDGVDIDDVDTLEVVNAARSAMGAFSSSKVVKMPAWEEDKIVDISSVPHRNEFAMVGFAENDYDADVDDVESEDENCEDEEDSKSDEKGQ